MTIGIPLALSAYSYVPLWKAFLETLGQNVVLSGPTHKGILDMGAAACVDDACLPVKIFHGQAQALDGRADMILLPRVMSMETKEYSCPMICGLPEMAQSSLKLKTPLIHLTMDRYAKPKGLYENLWEFGLHFTQNKRLLRWAYTAALQAHTLHQYLLEKGRWPRFVPDFAGDGGGEQTIGVLGHPYILYDLFLSGVVLRHLAGAGFRTVFPGGIGEDEIDRRAGALPKKMFWSAGKSLYGSAASMAASGVAGIVYLSSFACGVDSIIADLAERLLRRQGVPFTLISLDEHTGEAGVRTRIEAFCDMISRRRQHGRGHFLTWAIST